MKCWGRPKKLAVHNKLEMQFLIDSENFMQKDLKLMELFQFYGVILISILNRDIMCNFVHGGLFT